MFVNCALPLLVLSLTPAMMSFAVSLCRDSWAQLLVVLSPTLAVMLFAAVSPCQVGRTLLLLVLSFTSTMTFFNGDVQDAAWAILAALGAAGVLLFNSHIASLHGTVDFAAAFIITLIAESINKVIPCVAGLAEAKVDNGVCLLRSIAVVMSGLHPCLFDSKVSDNVRFPSSGGLQISAT